MLVALTSELYVPVRGAPGHVARRGEVVGGTAPVSSELVVDWSGHSRESLADAVAIRQELEIRSKRVDGNRGALAHCDAELENLEAQGAEAQRGVDALVERVRGCGTHWSEAREHLCVLADQVLDIEQKQEDVEAGVSTAAGHLEALQRDNAWALQGVLGRCNPMLDECCSHANRAQEAFLSGFGSSSFSMTTKRRRKGAER